MEKKEFFILSNLTRICFPLHCNIDSKHGDGCARKRACAPRGS